MTTFFGALVLLIYVPRVLRDLISSRVKVRVTCHVICEHFASIEKLSKTCAVVRKLVAVD